MTHYRHLRGLAHVLHLEVARVQKVRWYRYLRNLWCCDNVKQMQISQNILAHSMNRQLCGRCVHQFAFKNRTVLPMNVKKYIKLLKNRTVLPMNTKNTAQPVEKSYSGQLPTYKSHVNTTILRTISYCGMAGRSAYKIQPR